MTNLFTNLSNWKVKYICALLMFVCVGVGNAWADTKTFDKDDTWDHTGTSGTGSATDIAEDGLSVSTAKGYLDAGNHIRVYSGTTIVVSSTAGAMTKIAFTSTASGTSSNGPSKISKNSGSNGSYSYSGKVGTWTYSSGATSVTFDASAQFRFTQVVITYAAATISKTSITGLDYTYGSGPSTAQSFTVAGTHVTGNLTVSAPSNFEVSKTSSTSGFASSVTLIPSSGTVSSTTIYVRLASGKSAGTYGGASTYVTVTGGGIITKNVSVSGTVSAAASCSADVAIGTASLNGSFFGNTCFMPLRPDKCDSNSP